MTKTELMRRGRLFGGMHQAWRAYVRDIGKWPVTEWDHAVLRSASMRKWWQGGPIASALPSVVYGYTLRGEP